MKTMKRNWGKLLKFFLAGFFVFLFLITVSCAFANSNSSDNDSFDVEPIEIPNPLGSQSFSDLINAIIGVIFRLSLWIAPIMFIIAGFFFITAAGEPTKIETAKKMVLWTLIGLLVVFSSYAIINLFRQIFPQMKEQHPQNQNQSFQDQNFYTSLPNFSTDRTLMT